MSATTSIRTAGGMLTASLLARVGQGDTTLGGLSSADYHLPSGQSPREAANRAWTYLSGIWPAFRDAVTALPASDPAVRLTREQWLMHLFRELGYGRLQPTPTGGLVVDGTAYPVSHVWGATPIHLLGWNVPLDRRTPGVAGAAGRAPHALVQELLNRSDDHLWGVVSNGQVLRLLRDSSALSTQAYVEFDLVSMFEGESFADFVVLFLLLHESRLSVTPGEPPATCRLERWRDVAAASGTRAMASLRDGVAEALQILGTGFLTHPENAVLRHMVGVGEASAEISAAEYQRALLRLVYRLLFLFVAEDRDALLDPSAPPEARERYRRFFSTARLRRRALQRRGSQHADLWDALCLVITRLGDERGCPELALPGIGGLFDDTGEEFLLTARLSNRTLLDAVRALSVVHPRGEVRQSVDYRNLGAEELGSVYESLLEYVPRLNTADRTFTLEQLAGNDRKTTGSYYTPSSLIDLVLDETLTPLLDEAERSPDPESALLALTVCDPACGSGHFLVAAARRLAERLAMARSGEQDPTPGDLAEAMRDVVATCIYGVDLNPMAAELAKVSLWLESMEAGRPLSFLDAHIKVGNSLLGTTPALLAQGVPDAAFVVLEGDDKKATAALKKRNANERKAQAQEDGGQFDLFDTGGLSSGFSSRVGRAEVTRATTLAELHAAQRRYQEAQNDPRLARERWHADTWCAAFVQLKGEGLPTITTSTVEAAREDRLDATTRAEVGRLQAQYGFFHWHLEFPEIFDVSLGDGEHGWRGGFAAVVGNPPWETVQMSEKEFFAQRAPHIAGARNASARKQAIEALQHDDPLLHEEFVRARRFASGQNTLVRSGRYPLVARGKINTYAVFAELFRSLLSPEGRMGIIAPTGLATDATTAAFFADTVRHRRLATFYDFENEAKIFPGIHNQIRFSITVITGGRPSSDARLAFYTRHVADTSKRRYGLTPDEILMLNPNTGTLPMFRSRRDAEITLKIYRRFPVLIDETTGENSWGLTFKQGLFNMATDSGIFRSAEDLEAEGAAFDGWAYVNDTRRWLPLYEGKMLNHYDHRYSTYQGATQAQLNKGTLPRLSDEAHRDWEQEARARYWVAEKDVESAVGTRWDRGWFLGWRDITNASNMRTHVPSAIPRSAVGHKLPLVQPSPPSNAPALQATWSSLVHDYVARQKLSSTGMTYFILKQLTTPPPAVFREPLPGVCTELLAEWLRPRVLELTYTSRRMAPYARDVLGLPEDGDPGVPFRWNPERRAHLMAEIDAAMFHLYGLDRDEVEHVLDSFTVVRKYDERDHGSYVTKTRILALYDAMASHTPGTRRSEA
ncbi:Eco57I restriction-modification methylase domain-containing protein [Mobilicoccus pelagius]|uniref:site-specific DNA-methyltransferase (adenine-specific) n=1 Tax=Mobilicoccus pelagius NBRC 104925 TaxID=1089455 RepID=H5USA0_9MICO|nr:N-6 DNA methylase [Mobilicoccus pelagius]GAB48608.1 putative type II DNA modification enzyme [Mobilicoccus pelagius NBRC 104925]